MFDWFKRGPKFTAADVETMINRAVEAERESNRRVFMRAAQQAESMPPASAHDRMRRLWQKAPKWAVPAWNPELRICRLRDQDLIEWERRGSVSAKHIAWLLANKHKPHYRKSMVNGGWVRYVTRIR